MKKIKSLLLFAYIFIGTLAFFWTVEVWFQGFIKGTAFNFCDRILSGAFCIFAFLMISSQRFRKAFFRFSGFITAYVTFITVLLSYMLTRTVLLQFTSTSADMIMTAMFLTWRAFLAAFFLERDLREEPVSEKISVHVINCFLYGLSLIFMGSGKKYPYIHHMGTKYLFSWMITASVIYTVCCTVSLNRRKRQEAERKAEEELKARQEKERQESERSEKERQERERREREQREYERQQQQRQWQQKQWEKRQRESRQREQRQERERHTYGSYEFFKGCTGVDEVKRLHRSLSKKYHPDNGGDAAVFARMEAEYRKIISGMSA